jgi:hypothetical protein
MKKTLALAVAGALALPALAQAQSPVLIEKHVPHAHDFLADAAGAKASAEAWRAWADDFRASFGTAYGSRLAPAKPVKGAPYSAEVITESNQALADGNVISKKTGGRVYRDAEGRTRLETVVNGEARSIQISDPVDGKSVMLLPGSRKAIPLPRVDLAQETKDVRVLKMGKREIRIENGKVSVDGKDVVSGKVELNVNGKEIRIENGKVWIDGKEMAGGAGVPRITMKHTEDARGEDAAVRKEIQVRVIRAGDGEGKEVTIGMPPLPPVPPAPPLPPGGPHAMRLDGALAKAKGTTTSLGTKDFDGVKAEGKSTLHTIPAGEIGNRNPILVTTETWYSPELQVTVFSRTSDPRYGETIYRLANIKRGEPAAELFKVPEDYSTGGKRSKG